MLKFSDGSIYETMTGTIAVTDLTNSGQYKNTVGSVVPLAQTAYEWTTYPSIWNGYPVYVCQDKTKKAIEILKALQADKQLECKSVNKFIELVEKIAGLL